MFKSLVGGFAKISAIGNGEYPQLIKKIVWVARIQARFGSWLSATVIIPRENIPLDGKRGPTLKKGDHVWLRKVKLQPISSSN
jgi:hypothetical protein